MFARNITFDASSMKRRQLISFAINAVVFVLAAFALVFSYANLDTVPKMVRLALLFLTVCELVLLPMGTVRYLKIGRNNYVEEITVTDNEITINGDSFPVEEDSDSKLCFDNILDYDFLNLMGSSISIRNEKNRPIKTFWTGPSRHGDSEEKRKELKEAIKTARENKAAEVIKQRIEEASDRTEEEAIHIEFPVDAMRKQMISSALLLMIMGSLMWCIGHFPLSDGSYVYSIGETFGGLTVLYGICYGLYAMYNMTRAVKTVEISPKVLRVNGDTYDLTTDPVISLSTTFNMHDNDRAIDLSVYLTIESAGVKRKYWAGPKNEKRSADARRKLIVAVESYK
ncbi:MAG: hypothetical protein K6F49_00815 [Saccharofermentans sp.]|nr:hypothetical protein [Saccharofermentans sp.]